MLRHSLLCGRSVSTLKSLAAFSVAPPTCTHHPRHLPDRLNSTAAPIPSIKARNFSMSATRDERKFGSGDPHTQSADDTQGIVTGCDELKEGEPVPRAMQDLVQDVVQQDRAAHGSANTQQQQRANASRTSAQTKQGEGTAQDEQFGARDAFNVGMTGAASGRGSGGVREEDAAGGTRTETTSGYMVPSSGVGSGGEGGAGAAERAAGSGGSGSKGQTKTGGSVDTGSAAASKAYGSTE